MCLFAGQALSAQGQEKLRQLYQEASQAERTSDYPTAIRLYRQIIAARPDLAEAHANLGNLQYLQGQYDDAQRSFQTASKLKPQLAGPHFFLGVLAFRANDLQGAEASLNKAAKLDPANPQIQLHLGYVSYARGNFEQAIGHIEQSLASDEKNEDGWYHLSKAYSQESRRFFEELQRKYPDSYYTHLARAHFFEAQANWREAAEEYQKALAQNPSASLKERVSFLEARNSGRDTPFVSAGDEVDGSTSFLYNTPATSDLPDLHRKWKAAIRTAAASSDVPARLYKQAEAYQLLSYLAAMWVYANSPESYRAHQLKAQSLEAAGRGDEAIAEYRKALESNPQLRTVHFAIGNLYWREAKFEEAQQELNAELSLSPNDPDAHYEVGDILFTQGKLDEAIPHFLACLRFAPDTIEAHLALERIYNSKGVPEKALHHLNEAARIAPTEATPHYRLWLQYRKQGRTEEAERERALFQKLKQPGKAGDPTEPK